MKHMNVFNAYFSNQSRVSWMTIYFLSSGNISYNYNPSEVLMKLTPGF